MMSKTMYDFVVALEEARACTSALERAQQFPTPQAFWRALGANDRVAAEDVNVIRPTSSDWMCRLLRITEGRSIIHQTLDCPWCASDPAAILRKFPRIGMKAGKIVAYPAKGAK